MTPADDHWWLLKLVLTPSGVRVDARDETGRRMGGEEVSWPLPLTVEGGSIHVPVTLLDRLRESHEFGFGQTPPLFVRPPDGLRALPWIDTFRSLLREWQLDRFEPVRLARASWKASDALRLPLKVLAVGPEGRAAAEALEGSQDGLLVRFADEPGFASALVGYEPDLVLVSSPALAQVRGRVPRPRYTVVLDHEESDPVWRRAQRAPPGGAMVWTPLAGRASGASFVQSLVQGLALDQPLHLAHRDAALAAGELMESSTVIADPETNRGLRLYETVQRLTDRAVELGSGAGEPEGRAGAARGADPEGVASDALRSLSFVRPSGLVVPDSAVRNLTDILHGERLMARAERLHEEARAERSELPLGEIADRESSQQRVVDVTMQRRHSELADPDALWVDGRSGLQRGAGYRLLVRIGQRSGQSLVRGAPEPLDPLLPATGDEGHELDVVVFGQDFVVLGAARRLLVLPRLGPSSVLVFDVKAPPDSEVDRGRLRIGIFYRNYLVQSLLLTAAVGSDEEPAEGEEPALSVEVELSQAGRFEDVGALPERLLSLGVNASDGTHTVWLTSEDVHGDVTLPELALDSKIAWFRGVLAEATGDGNSPRFPSWSSPGRTPTPEFHATLLELAYGGGEAYNALFVKIRPSTSDPEVSDSGALKRALRRVAEASDDVIQIAWHDQNYAFPWSVLYDYKLPLSLDPDAEFCLGYAPGDPPVAGEPPRKTCAHGPDDMQLCVYGFWGVRHRLENLRPNGDDSRAPIDEIKCPPRKAVHVATGLPPENTRDIAGRLRDKLTDAVVGELGSEEDLVDVLFATDAPQSRPGMVVVVGHLLTDAPLGSRIDLGGDRLLNGLGITQRQYDVIDAWQQPNPLVLLLACESAKIELRTLGSMVDALASAGAAGIVGTEYDVFSGLSSRFAFEVTVAMWGDDDTPAMSLGTAITAFRRRLLLEGNPLGFVFTPFGRSELHLVH